MTLFFLKLTSNKEKRASIFSSQTIISKTLLLYEMHLYFDV